MLPSGFTSRLRGSNLPTS